MKWRNIENPSTEDPHKKCAAEKRTYYVLKPLQNKKGKKKIPGAQFSVSFSQLPAVKKDTENCAPGNF